MEIDILVYFSKKEKKSCLEIIKPWLESLHVKARINLEILTNHFEKFGQAREKSLKLQQAEIVKHLKGQSLLVQVTTGGTEVTHQDFIDFVKKAELSASQSVQFCLSPDVELAHLMKSKFDAHFAFSKLDLSASVCLQILLAELDIIIKK